MTKPVKRPLVVAITRGGPLHKTLGKSTNKEMQWPELVSMLSIAPKDNVTMAEFLALPTHEQSTRKNKVGAFVGGSFSDGRRNSDSIEFRSVVTLDVDENSADLWAQANSEEGIAGLAGLAYQVHTTRKHTAAKPRLRIVVPLSRDVTPEEYVPVLCGVAKMVDPVMKAVSTESFVAVQVMFLPTVCKGETFFCMDAPGDFLDPRTLLKKYPVDKPETWPKSAGKSVKPFSRAKMTHPEDKKAQAPIIAATHRCYDPHHFIEAFLGDVYIQSGKRYMPYGATGAASVRVYDDAFIQSDHGSDPANGQHNSFDLGRIHLFGDLDEDYDLESLSPVEWPSYKAMVEFMLEQDGIAEAMAEIEQEVEEERNQGVMDLLDDLDDDEDVEDEPEPEPVDEYDDLVGGKAKPEKKAKTSDDVLAKVRKLIARAKNLDGLVKLLERIQAIPVSDFKERLRELVVGDVQRKFKELDGQTVSKTLVRKMLVPTVENLRKQREGEELPAWLKEWVFVSVENKFLHMGTKQLVGRDGFNGMYLIQAGEEVGVTQQGLPRLLPADIALAVCDIAKPFCTRYIPGMPELFEEDAVLYANTYRPGTPASGGYKGKDGIKLLKRLLADLFPDPRNQAIVLDFMAHCYLHPEKKLKYALLIKGSENEGKSMFGMLMRYLLGASNWTTIGTDQLKEKHNGWAYEKLFCVVEEIKIPGREAYEVLNKIKPMITNPTVSIRRMQKDATAEPNFCNIYLTTNFEDCLPLEEDNTRFCVLFTRFLRNEEVIEWHEQLLKDEGVIYTRQLWDHIQQHPLQFADFFNKYKFSQWYDAEGRAPGTEFKEVMAEDGKSEERVLLEEIILHGNDKSISNDILIWSNFRDILDQKGMGQKLHNRAVPNFLKPMGYIKARKETMRVDGTPKTITVWTRNMSLIDRKDRNSLTLEGKKLVKMALETNESIEDDEDFSDLI